MRSSGANRLFAKLALLLVPAFVVPASIGLWSLAALDIDAEHNRLTSRIGNSAARVASAIGRQLDTGVDQGVTGPIIEELLGTLLSDSAVRRAELVGDLDDERRLVVPPRISCPAR